MQTCQLDGVVRGTAAVPGCVRPSLVVGVHDLFQPPMCLVCFKIPPHQTSAVQMCFVAVLHIVTITTSLHVERVACINVRHKFRGVVESAMARLLQQARFPVRDTHLPGLLGTSRIFR